MRRTFWGSSGSSVGCGQRTFVPSCVNLSLDATTSPSSAFASLSIICDELNNKYHWFEELTLGRWSSALRFPREMTTNQWLATYSFYLRRPACQWTVQTWWLANTCRLHLRGARSTLLRIVPESEISHRSEISLFPFQIYSALETWNSLILCKGRREQKVMYNAQCEMCK